MDANQQYILSKNVRIQNISGVLFGINLTNCSAQNALFRAILASAFNLSNGNEGDDILSLITTSEARALVPRLISDLKSK